MSEDQAFQPSEPEWQRKAELVGVSFPERKVRLIVMPYEKPSPVPWQDRMVDETIARGAFDGIERRANRVRVNRDHRDERVVGRATAFHPGHDAGLAADVKISQTDLGDETLQLCADGVLSASAGFLPLRGGMRWDGPNAYTITKAWLGHIAFTPSPAHEDAEVLEVRNFQPVFSATPNRDSFLALLAADRVAAMAASLTVQ